ncbi:HAD family hydrolase [Salipiger sp. PrR003]|uniref:HAD family hydrolase n=1 Tax=Salipiger sp. PrR003 TaxID=2706776 RepID=UPI0013DA36C5|nr:HAD family hydrolase [Salipiger sp. PrR003]NDV52945.1 HAD family hydrolase [Salipiger sp. PrR003]
MDHKLSGIELICFDLFGTLVEIREPRWPHRMLLQAIPGADKHQLRRTLLTRAIPLEQVPSALGISMPSETLSAAQEALSHELASIRVRDGVSAMLASLPVPYAVCSNLSVHYAPALNMHHALSPTFSVMSFEVGYVKPDPEIYGIVLSRAGLTPDQVLFVGDTPAADIEGPRQAGMRAMHIDDFLPSTRTLLSMPQAD